MSLGQVMVGIKGLELLPEERAVLRHPNVGGVILFSRNYRDRVQLNTLTDAIHAVREPRLLVAVDQEGGRVQRFRSEFTALPPPARLGEIYDREPRRGKALAEATGFLMAAELRAVGVDMSFAPVLDLGRGVSRVIGERAFHHDPEVVSVLAQAYVRGMRRAGMAATGKHFPGHGSVVPDSHLELPRDERRREDILNEDLLPFARLARAGIAALMASHVLYPAVDTTPAGFSLVWINDILRGEIGFQGVIVSDDLGMQAACEYGDYPTRARAAINAGCDLILLCNEFDMIDPVLKALPPPSPVAAMRLARLHGKPSAEAVPGSREWRDAALAVASYAGPDSSPGRPG